MEEENEKNGEAANSIECRDMGEASGIFRVAGLRGGQGMRYVHNCIIHDPEVLDRAKRT